MWKPLTLGTLAALTLVGCDSRAQERSEAGGLDDDPERYQAFHPDDIEWQPAPPAFERGAEIAILEGDPSIAGEIYTFRLKMPPGYVIAPHTHPLPERAVVLSGEFYLGHETELDKETASRLDPGTYFTVPPGMIHYVMTGNESETVLHITSTGPLEISYVDPEDDPRQK